MRIVQQEQNYSDIVENNPSQDLLSMRVSKGIVKDTSLAPKSSRYRQTPYDYKIFVEMMVNDPLITAAFDATVDVATKNGYGFSPRQGFNPKPGRIDKAQEFFDNTLNFDELLDNLIYNLLLHNIAYVEFRSKKELHVLETTEMVIDYDDNGDVQTYYQNPDRQNEVSWTPDEIILFRQRIIGSRIYPYSNMESIARGYTTNIRAQDFLSQVFLNMPPKLAWILKNASDSQRKTFIQNLRVAKTNYLVDLVINAKEGAEIQNTLQGAGDMYQGLLSVMNYLREQVLSITRVPPIWLGIISDSGANRGNAEAQITSFETRVQKMQNKIESQVNKELMTKLGYNDLLFKFNNFSLQDEKLHFQNAQIMSAIGFRPEDIVHFLKNKGISLPADATIEKPEPAMAGGVGLSKTLQRDNSPSRQRMDAKNDKMNTNINEKGVSDAGGAKIKEQNIKVRTSTTTQGDWYYPAIIPEE